MACFAGRYLPSCAALPLIARGGHTETITHPTLVQLVAAGAVCAVITVGQPSGWTLLVRYGLAECALAAAKSFSQARYPGALSAGDRGEPFRG